MIEITAVLLGVGIGTVFAGLLFTWLVTRFADALFELGYQHGRNFTVEAVNVYNATNGYPQIGFAKTVKQPEPQP